MKGSSSLRTWPSAQRRRVTRRSLGVGLALFGVIVQTACIVNWTAPPNPNGKVAGLQCSDGSECQSLSCKSGKCTPVTGGNPTDNIKNGDETDVDCGGSAPKCADGKSCEVADDCESDICTGGKCRAPSPDDGAKNGDETDVDCGGSKAPKCAVDKSCETHDDCESSACSYAKKCVAFPSCTGHFGGDTCGAGETGADAQHESCCATANDTQSGIQISKYYVTAGRMRAFVERFQGNLQEWANNAPRWDSTLTPQLPASMDAALNLLGPNGKRGCSIPGQGGRTYWQKDANGDSRETSDFTQDVLDEKALNCVPWVLAQALCHFDGGRLASSTEIIAQMNNHGATRWPWGNTPDFRVRQQLDQIVYAYSYQTPNPPADLRPGSNNSPLDRAFFVAPPGRRPLGNNQIGVADGIGNVMSWVNDGQNRFSWTASWEDSHTPAGVSGAARVDSWPPSSGSSNERLGYWAIGARCAFDR